MRPWAIDLYCGAGGASMGLWHGGFNVVGVDDRPQPNYPFTFIHADALDGAVRIEDFDFAWASPPCQAFSSLRHLHKDRHYPDLIEPTRRKLSRAGLPFVLENVPHAPLHDPVLLCGSMFPGLRVWRHRLFEIHGFGIGLLPSCNHAACREPVDISGTGYRRKGPRPDKGGGNSRKPLNLADARDCSGLYWMSRKEIAQAIPPAYAEFIGRAALRQLGTRHTAEAAE